MVNINVDSLRLKLAVTAGNLNFFTAVGTLAEAGTVAASSEILPFSLVVFGFCRACWVWQRLH